MTGHLSSFSSPVVQRSNQGDLWGFLSEDEPKSHPFHLGWIDLSGCGELQCVAHDESVVDTLDVSFTCQTCVQGGNA